MYGAYETRGVRESAGRRGCECPPPPETNYSVPNFLPGSPVLAAPQLDGDDDGLDDYDDENGEDGGKVKGGLGVNFRRG